MFFRECCSAFLLSVAPSYISVFFCSVAICSEMQVVAHVGFGPSRRCCLLGGTMATADSLQTVYSAALSRLSRVSPNSICYFHPVPSASTLWILDDVSDFGTYGNLIHPSGLICSFCSCSRGFPSNFLSHEFLPSRSCLVPAPRALTLAGQTLMGLANQPYSRRLLSGLGFRIITVPCGLSPQFAYRGYRKTGTFPNVPALTNQL